MSSEKIIQLGATNFDAAVKASFAAPVVVDFWAPWCGPCKAIAPVLEQIAEELGDAVKIAKVNVAEEENRELAVEHGVQNIPTLLFFKDGALVQRVVGVQSKANIVAIIKGL